MSLNVCGNDLQVHTTYMVLIITRTLLVHTRMVTVYFDFEYKQTFFAL